MIYKSDVDEKIDQLEKEIKSLKDSRTDEFYRFLVSLTTLGWTIFDDYIDDVYLFSPRVDLYSLDEYNNFSEWINTIPTCEYYIIDDRCAVRFLLFLLRETI